MSDWEQCEFVKEFTEKKIPGKFDGPLVMWTGEQWVVSWTGFLLFVKEIIS